MTERVVVIGVGNSLRGDDAAGLLVARRVRERAPGVDVFEHEGEPTGLLALFGGAHTAILVDAVQGAGEPGSVQRFEAGDEPLPASLRGSTSTHAVGLAEAIELFRALGRLPPRVVVLGIRGACFEAGRVCSPEIRDGIEAAASAVLGELAQLRR